VEQMKVGVSVVKMLGFDSTKSDEKQRTSVTVPDQQVCRSDQAFTLIRMNDANAMGTKHFEPSEILGILLDFGRCSMHSLALDRKFASRSSSRYSAHNVPPVVRPS
jgi:hypothetical protein